MRNRVGGVRMVILPVYIRVGPENRQTAVGTGPSTNATVTSTLRHIPVRVPFPHPVMIQRSNHHTTRGRRTVSALLLTLVACGGSETRDAATAAKMAAAPGATKCSGTGGSPVAVAVRDFIRNAAPAPQRFLSAAGSDSAVPEEGFKVLQDKGPSFYYSSDTVAQRKMRAKLEGDGPYASMLVVYHGKTAAPSGDSVTVSLGGHYVGGVQHGTVSPTRQIRVACDTSGWKVVAAEATP